MVEKRYMAAFAAAVLTGMVAGGDSMNEGRGGDHPRGGDKAGPGGRGDTVCPGHPRGERLSPGALPGNFGTLLDVKD